ncbi:MAG: D-alanyl-D-alanine carboxypeptidase family protein [Eubacteriales bacterium]|nr:D-alanyl-D-alanine carboxypeptidase family protein [Eubacteriales bacterium]
MEQYGAAAQRKRRLRERRRTVFFRPALFAAAFFFALWLLLPQTVRAEAADQRKSEKGSTASRLYAQAAVLMDADNGRILLGKNEGQRLAMASTTKIMTCILVLELGKTGELAQVSAYAAAQPKVHLGAYPGESYRVEDLLYSLMLESHNDAAVILAEHYGGRMIGLVEGAAGRSREDSSGAVLAFVEKMNEKARELGCEDTFFVTPNGLDGTMELERDGETILCEHSTTAADLARIMRYCVEKSPRREEFLEITRKPSYRFSNWKTGEDGSVSEGGRTISCVNHNAFLQMMEGALSGKTGFTGKAGYCYVGALARDGKRFTIALLACGWPNNKAWKWHDARLLYEYGLENYERCDIYREWGPYRIAVENGQKKETRLISPKQELCLLLSREDRVEIKSDVPRRLTAPVEKGQRVGEIRYYVNGALYASLPVTALENVPEITYFYCVRRILRFFSL